MHALNLAEPMLRQLELCVWKARFVLLSAKSFVQNAPSPPPILCPITNLVQRASTGQSGLHSLVVCPGLWNKKERKKRRKKTRAHELIKQRRHMACHQKRISCYTHHIVLTVAVGRDCGCDSGQDAGLELLFLGFGIRL